MADVNDLWKENHGSVLEGNLVRPWQFYEGNSA